MSRVVFAVAAVAAMVVAAAAFPSTQFVKVDTYSNALNCTNAATATPTGINWYPTDYCIVAGITASKYVFDNSMNNVVSWTYTNAQCTGAATLNTNYSVGLCTTNSHRKLSLLTSSVGMISTSSYGSAGCGSDLQSVSFFMQGCRSSQGTTYTVGGKLEICFPTDSNNNGDGQTDCGGDVQCESVSRDCFDAGNGSVMYDWNAAPAVAPAVALTAALMAFVVAASKF